jgi:deazaflavin-dependent oxidoreductase (nitroreductase family)
MPISRSPGGTRGARTLPAPIARVVMPMMQWVHRRTGDRFRGSDLLYLTTVGARSGERRTNPVARFDDGGGGWLVVASFGGAARHPAWYHNLSAHPDQVWAEVSGTTHHVHAEQLDDAAHGAAWARITARAPGFLAYADKTDRRIPVLRLTPRPAAGT